MKTMLTKMMKVVAALLVAASATLSASAEAVTADDVAAVVAGWKNAREALGEQLEAEPASVKEYYGLGGTGTYYVVSLEGGGYVVTSGDTSLEPVLAYSKTGTWIDDVKRNPLMAMLEIDIAAATAAKETASVQQQGGGLRLASGVTASVQQQEGNAAKWARYKAAASQKGGLRLQASAPNSDLRVSPLIQSAWSQTGPRGTGPGVTPGGENYYTPGNVYCGCVATMAAQMMKYWEWPKGTNIFAIANYYGSVIFVNNSYGTAVTNSWSVSEGFPADIRTKNSSKSPLNPSFGGTYDWANMPNTTQTSLSDAQKAAIGKLTRDAGIACCMGYSNDGSGAFGSIFAHRAADQFAYTSGQDVGGWNDANRDALLACLDAGIPCGIAVSHSSSGHAIIADGYGYNSSGTLYVHFNYGWGSTGPSDWYTPPSVGDYNSVNDIIANVYPPYMSKYDRTIVSGRVFSNGSVQSSVTVTASNRETGFTTNVTSNAKGIYSFMLPRGYYTFSATKNGSSAKVEADVKLGIAGTGSNAKSGNIHGLDLNLGTAVTAPSVALTHRWSFAGNLNDSVGSSNASTIGSNVSLVDGKAVCTGNGAGQGSLNLGANLLNTDGATVEVWARQDEAVGNARVFEYGVDTSGYFTFTWSHNGDIYGDLEESISGGASGNAQDKLAPYALGVFYHISATFERQGDGSTVIRIMRRDAASGALLRASVLKMPNGMQSLTDPTLYLGRSLWNDADARATYDEVRVWQGVLSDAQLKASALAGPDANLSTLPWNASAVRYVAKAVWQGGATVPTASSLASSANWSCTDQNGDAITGVPDHRSVVIIPNGSTAFTIPAGFTPNWRKFQIGSEGKATAQWGKKTYTQSSVSAQLDPPASAYDLQGDANVDELARSVAPSVQDAPAGLSGKQFRYDGWVYVTAAQAGRWAVSAYADDYAAFRLDDEWLAFTRVMDDGIRTAVADVPKGWHRFTIIIGDYYGGYGGCAVPTDHSCATPVTISIDGGNGIAFTSSNFQFGAPDRAAPAVTLSSDADWSGVGEVSLDSGAELDLNGHNLTLSGASSSYLGGTIKNTSATQSRITLANGGTIDSANISLVGDIGFGGATLIHRWSFNGTTDAENLTDSVGGAVAWKEKWPDTTSSTHTQGGNVTFSNGKAVIGGGGANGYLNLGTGLLGAEDGTIEIWLKKKFNGSVWSYLFAFGQHDTTGDPGFFTMANSRYNDTTRTPLNFRVNSANAGIYGDDMGLPLPVGMSCHVSLTFKGNGSGGTFVRCMFRDCETGFILKEQSCTVNNWTLANATEWALTLGHNPWVNSNYDVNSEFDEVRCWNGVLNDDQLTAGVIAGPDTVIGAGVENFIINANTTFDVPTAGGGYGFWTDKTVVLGAGAKIRFDTTGYFGKGLRFRTGGFVPSSGSALDFVELSDSENYVATMENANTILVRLKDAIPYESTWTGGTPSLASDFANPVNWTSVNAAGTTISAVPTNTTTVILPATVLATFTLPSGFAPSWGRVLLGGHTKSKYGFKDGTPVNSTMEWRDLAFSGYTTVSDIPNGKQQGAAYLASTATPSELGTAQIRLDGWFYVTSAQAGKWTLPNKFDDVSAFAIDGQWLYLLNTYRIDSTGGAFVSEGWHRYTIAVGDTGGGWGSNFSVGGANYPFGVSINGAANVAFTEANFTFGSDTDTVTLAGDTDWRALGVLDVTGGVTIDLNGHNLAVADITRSSLGASIVDGSATGSSLYVNGLPSESLAQASGMVSVPIVQYGQKSAVWTGAENDGGNALTPGNWAVRNGAGMTVTGIPDNETAVAVSGENVNLQIPSGSAFRCQSLAIGNCTLTADCDWRGLTVTPTITGTADLNGHNLRLNHLSAGGGAALANSAEGVAGVVFDATAGNYNESSYVDGLANLGTSENAHIIILRNGDDSMSSLNVGNTANVWTEVRMASGTITESGTAQIVNTANAHGVLTVDGADVTVNALNAPNGNKAGTATLNVHSGSFTVTTWTDFGNSASAVSTVNQTGGTVDVGTVCKGNTGNGNFWFGRSNSGTATYNISDGTFTAWGSFRIGSAGSGKGIFIQSGGIVNVMSPSYDFSFGYDSSTSGKYYQTGGTLNTERNIDLRRSGSLLDIGGAVTMTVDGKGVNIATVSGESGEVILREGGVLTTSFIKKGSGTAKATFAGGKIVAKDAGNASTFIANIDDVIYAAGGLTVDTAGYNVSMTNNTASAASAGSALVKQGAGTLTVDSLPPVRNVLIDAGALKLVSDGAGHPSVNAESGNEYTASPSTTVLRNDYLLHRWNFNGQCYDLIGTNNAVFKGTSTYSYQSGNTEIKIPGGTRGTGWLDCGSNIIPAELGDTPFTIEMWVKVHSLHNWDQWFAFGNSSNPAGTSGALTGLILAPKSGAGSYPSFRAVGARTSNNVAVGSGNLTANKEYHVAAVVTPTGGSTATVTLYIEDPSGEEEIRVQSENVTNWSTATIVQDNFWLGHSHWGDQDAAASYNEVRVWAAALSQAQVEANGTLGADTLPVLSNCSALDMAECADIASGATLDITEHTLTLPVLKGSGMVRGGMLDITDSLVVNLTDCIAGNCITASGIIDFTGAKLVLEDPEVLETHNGAIWFIRTASGGSLTFIGKPECAQPLPTGWSISCTSKGAKLTKSGLSIHLR